MTGGRVVAFGEMMIRLSPPGREILFQSPRLETWLAGAEANVVTALANLGHQTAMISAVPDNALGDAAIRHLRGHGVDCSRVRRADGRMGLYWVETGAGLRPTRIVYDRAHSAFAEMPAAEWDWDALLDGAAWLHLSGITPALGPKGTDAALAAASAADARGIKLSFDCNYRANLWGRWDSQPRETLRRLIGRAALLFGNHRDISLILGRTFSGDAARRRREAAEAMFDAFPRVQAIASTARHPINVDHHRLSARVDLRDGAFETPEIDLPGIVDRIGTGDAFAAGVLHAWLEERTPEDMAATGLALAAYKHTVPGDASPIRADELDQFLHGGFDVKR